MNRVVVVEDETMARKGIILTIDWSALGCVVVGEAANGEEGAALVERLSPDIVVTDVKMPRMDGVEMIAKLRENGCQAKFIILTAYSDFKYAQSALRLGVSDYRTVKASASRLPLAWRLKAAFSIPSMCPMLTVLNRQTISFLA